MLNSVAGGAVSTADDKARRLKDRESLVEWLVSAEKITKHLIRANFRLITLEDLACALEIVFIAFCFESCEELVSKVVWVPQPEVQLLEEYL